MGRSMTCPQHASNGTKGDFYPHTLISSEIPVLTRPCHDIFKLRCAIFGGYYLQRRSRRGRSSGSRHSSGRGCCTRSRGTFCAGCGRRTGTAYRRRQSQSPGCVWRPAGSPGGTHATSGCPCRRLWVPASCSGRNSHWARRRRIPCRCTPRPRRTGRRRPGPCRPSERCSSAAGQGWARAYLSCRWTCSSPGRRRPRCRPCYLQGEVWRHPGRTPCFAAHRSRRCASAAY